MSQNEKTRAHRTECLTARELVAYATREVPPEKLAELEEHLSDCRLCLDATAGVRELADAESFVGTVESLNAKVRHRSKARARLNPSWQQLFALAATLVLGVGGAVYLFRTAPNEALFSESFEPYPSTAPQVRGESQRGALAQALARYEAGDYARALDTLEGLVQEQPRDAVAVFYAGVSQLALNRPREAVSSFERALAAGKTELSEPAQWYLALSYLKLNETPNAELTLRRIAGSSGFYKGRAEALLARLEAR